MNLFIDTSNDFLILALFENQIIKDSYFAPAARQLTEKTIPELKKLLQKNNLDLKDISNFYIVVGPGSYTGVRVGITIIKSVYALNPNINVYCINSLLFQAGVEARISIIDAKSDYKYFAVYNKGKEMVPPQLLTWENVQEIVKAFQDYPVVDDYSKVDFLTNLINLEKMFIKCKDVPELEPLYIKKVI